MYVLALHKHKHFMSAVQWNHLSLEKTEILSMFIYMEVLKKKKKKDLVNKCIGYTFF